MRDPRPLPDDVDYPHSPHTMEPTYHNSFTIRALIHIPLASIFASIGIVRWLETGHIVHPCLSIVAAGYVILRMFN